MTKKPIERCLHPACSPTGIEAAVCNDIAERQQKGIAKYGVTVAEWCQVSTAAATGLIDRMEKAGQVKRLHVAHDRRSIFLNLTEKGKETAEKLLNAIVVAPATLEPESTKDVMAGCPPTSC